ncbi:PQQ-binding-like beta-propeller repeat protein [Micromonospora sp. NPDC047465]|uniref:PQQ-binding-like beta-propeller repeat protein n=1 Tax=Micromonospora sp. NPDC047465 TaxID=3154813 RepID=UPI0033EFE2CB
MTGNLSRRALLAGLGAVTAAAVSPRAALAAPDGDLGETFDVAITDLGAASRVLNFGNGVRVGDEIWFATRQILPTRVAAYDLTQRRITKTALIPGVPGLWGIDAVGTDLFVSSYSPGLLFKVDTVTLEVTRVLDLKEEVGWTVKASPDGRVFVGTYPSAKLWEYDPATDRATDHGRMDPDDTYVRDLVATDTTVYCGIGSHAGLVAYDRATGTRTDILPAALRDRTFGAVCHLAGDHLVVGISPTAEILVVDTRDHSRHQILKTPNDSFVVGITSRGDEIFYTTRPSGSLYRFRLGDTAPTLVGVPIAEASNVRIGFLDDGRLWAVQTAGGIFYDLDTRTTEALDMSSPDLAPTPERPMSLCHAGDRIVVGGTLGVQVVSTEATAAFDTFRVPFGGEAKDMETYGGLVHMGVYTLARYLTLPVDGRAATEVARVDAGQEQTRPTSLTVDRRRGLVLMSTEPDYGRWEGALNIYDGQRIRSWRGILPDQTVQSLCPDPHGVFLGGSIRNGYGTTPTTSRARLGYFDYRTERLAWLVEPTSGGVIVDLKLIGRVLVGVTSEGELFALDPRTREVLWRIDVGAAGGKLAVIDDRVFGVDGTRLWTVPVGRRQPTLTVLADGLNQSWFGAPEVVTDGVRALFTTRGTNLIRVDLS